ncbi:MAG: hypothetical protein V2G33_08080 [bacterium JZ-2024 1]
MNKAILLLMLFLWIFSSRVFSFPLAFPSYTLLMPSNLGCSAISVAEGWEPASVYLNPANITVFSRPSLSHSHSLRHFPVKSGEVDQLDADAVAFVFPAGWLGLFLGFSVAGEWGYDYRDLPYFWVEKEQLTGREESVGWGWSLGFIRAGYLGKNLRFRLITRKTSEEILNGKEKSRGVQVRLLPWLILGWSSTERAPSHFWTGIRTSSFSLVVRILPWYSWGQEWNHFFYHLPRAPVKFTRQNVVHHWKLPPFWMCRKKLESRALGLGVTYPFISLSYGEGKDLMPFLTGMEFPFFRDVHMGGYTIR